MNPNQPIHRRVNRSSRYVTSLGLVAALVPLACSGQVLSFGPTSTTALAEVASQKIADLTDNQANQVCAWLAGGYTNPPFVLPIPDSTQVPSAPGYLSGPGYGLYAPQTSARGARPYLAWIALAPQSACVANLRHSPCEATVASLEACVQYFQSHARSGSYGDAMTACAAFEGAADCDETVFQTHYPELTTAGEDDICTMLLPVAPGAVCPVYQTGAVDAGTD